MNQKNSLGLNKCFLDKIDPVDLFEVWMNEAKKTELNDPNALALATSEQNNSPSIIQPIAGPCDSPQVVKRNNFPKVLNDIIYII